MFDSNILTRKSVTIQNFYITLKKETIRQLIYMNEKYELGLSTYFPGTQRQTSTLTIYVTTYYYLQSGTNGEHENYGGHFKP